MRSLDLFKIRGITTRIALLLVLGLLGVIITSGGNLYLKSWTDKSMRLSDRGHAIVESVLNLMSFEERFINSNNSEFLADIERVKDNVKQNTAQARAVSANAAIHGLLDQVDGVSAQHAKIFDGIVQNLKSSRKSMTDLAECFRRIDSSSMAILTVINQEQTMATMTGEPMSETKLGLRDGINILNGYTKAAMVNLQGLFLLADSQNFTKTKDEISKKIALEQMNVKSQLKFIANPEFNKIWEEASKDFATLEELQKQLFTLWSGNRDLSPKLKETGDKAQELAASLINLTNDEIAANGRKGDIFNLTLILSILVCLVAGGIAVARSIIRPLNRAIGGLDESTEKVTLASVEVARSSQTVAEGTSQQAAAIEETSSSLEEMSSMTRQNADNSGQANRFMQEANKIVQNAAGAMTELTQSMDAINKASEETQKIIKTIDEIAFQTNLLALNAAVEAARAGEAGAGFAVVADEVRNLALRAAEASRSTAALIENTVKRTKEGNSLVERTSKDFKEVASIVTKSGELIGEISAASQEQAAGINQVGKAMSQMDKVTQQNAANAEESASASEELSVEAEKMKGFVSDLVVLVGGSRQTQGKRQRDTRAIPETTPVFTRKTASAAKHNGKGGSKGPKRIEPRAPVESSPKKLIPLEDDF